MRFDDAYKFDIYSEIIVSNSILVDHAQLFVVKEYSFIVVLIQIGLFVVTEHLLTSVEQRPMLLSGKPSGTRLAGMRR